VLPTRDGRAPRAHEAKLHLALGFSGPGPVRRAARSSRVACAAREVPITLCARRRASARMTPLPELRRRRSTWMVAEAAVAFRRRFMRLAVLQRGKAVVVGRADRSTGAVGRASNACCRLLALFRRRGGSAPAGLRPARCESPVLLRCQPYHVSDRRRNCAPRCVSFSLVPPFRGVSFVLILLVARFLVFLGFRGLRPLNLPLLLSFVTGVLFVLFPPLSPIFLSCPQWVSLALFFLFC